MATRQPPAAAGRPVLGQTLRFAREPLELTEELVAEHGRLFRMRVLGVGEFYTLAHPDHFERALVTDREAFAKHDDFRVAFGENVVSTEGEQWRRQREVLSEFFTPAKIRGYADRMVGLTERQLARWSDGGRRSLHDAMAATALDNLFGTIFDRPLDPDGDEALRRAANDINLWFKPTSFALPRWVPTPSRRRFREALATVEAEAQRLLRERERDGGGEDLLSTLVELRASEGAALTDEEIIDQVLGLVFAGHDTTALTLTYALHQLGTHDEVRRRVHAELADVLGGDRPTLADVGELPVLERVLNETLRAYPAIHTIPRQTTRAVTVDGYRLDPGTRAHLSVWVLHHDEAFWDDPWTWAPDRWADTTPQKAGYTFVPFGAGPRLCLGRRFARLEALLVLATVCQDYLVEPEAELAFEPMTTLQPADGVPVRVHRR
jgi:cytochrome P450